MDWVPIAHDSLLPFLVLLPCDASWDHLSNKPFTFIFLSQTLLLGELTVVFGCHIFGWNVTLGPLAHLLSAGMFPEAGARRKEQIRNLTSLVEP